MDLYIIRHGETKENKIGIVQGKGVNGELTDLGRKQAQHFFKKYHSKSFDYVYSSSLIRSIQTVEYFVDLGIKWIKDERIDEIDWGIHEGQKYNPQLVANYKNLIQSWNKGDWDAKLPGGESATELVNRVDAFIRDIQSLDAGKVLVCTHGRTIRCLLCRLLELDLREMEHFRHNNTGLFLVKFVDGRNQLVIKNDVSHLPDELIAGDHHIQ